jgi:hypothetical protein
VMHRRVVDVAALVGEQGVKVSAVQCGHLGAASVWSE